MGKICRLTNRHKVAQSYHRAALTLDPLLWCAYEELCWLGDIPFPAAFCRLRAAQAVLRHERPVSPRLAVHLLLKAFSTALWCCSVMYTKSVVPW